MIPYRHQGVVTTNGRMDLAQEITDATALQVQPADDGLQLSSFEAGNFEWWYFDVIDVRKGYVLKLVAHLGTDPLRKTFYPSVAVSALTPNGPKVMIQPFALDEFEASQTACDVWIKDAFHAWEVLSGDHHTYHVAIRLPSFSTVLEFQCHGAGWKPLGDAIPMQQGGRKAAFSWIIPVPTAKVVGTFCSDGVDYELETALGYHDHNVWRVDSQAKLFMDQVISHWHWGRFLNRETTVVFMDTHFDTHSLQSCLLAQNGTILHSSNNRVEVATAKEQWDPVMRTTYPSQLRMALPADRCALRMELTERSVIDSRDLLEGVSPLLKWLIRHLHSQPSYHGVLADATVSIGSENIHGEALYEAMYFRRKPWDKPRSSSFSRFMRHSRRTEEHA
jgi:hypothetical protein